MLSLIKERHLWLDEDSNLIKCHSSIRVNHYSHQVSTLCLYPHVHTFGWWYIHMLGGLCNHAIGHSCVHALWWLCLNVEVIGQ